MATNRASIGSADSRTEEFVHEIHPDQLPDSDATMGVDETPRAGQESGGGATSEGREGSRSGEGGDEKMEEMAEISARPIFVPGQGPPPPLPERQ